MTKRDIQEQLDLEQSRITLESFSNELWQDFKRSIFTRPEDDAIMAQRLSVVEQRLGIESLEDALAFTKRIAIAGQQRFGKFVETVQVFLDDTGQKEVERMRGLLGHVQGEAHGVFVDAKLANRLQIQGDVPKAFDKTLGEFHALGNRVLTRLVPHTAEIITKAATLIGPDYPRTAEAFRQQIDELLTFVHKAGDPVHLLDSTMLQYVGLGGRHLFNTLDHTPPPPSVSDEAELNEVRGYIAHSSIYRLNKKIDRIVGVAYNPRLPILDRHQIQTVIEQCEHLSTFIVRLVAVAKHHTRDFDGDYVSGRLVANLKQMRGGLVNDKDTHHLKDTGQPVEHAERVRAEVLGEYFRLSLLDHMATLESLCTLAIETHKTLSAYVHASLNHHK